MIFSPVSLQPDSKSIDASKINVFTWEFRGSNQTHYQVNIYNNQTSAQVYNSNKIASAVSSHSLPANTLSNNVEYKYTVTVFSGSESAISEFVFFKTNTTPVLTMTVPSSITTTHYDFSVSYSQAQNIAFTRYKFVLYDEADNVILDSGWIYDYVIKYSFDGFENNKTYKVESIVECPYELTGTTGKESFSVSYILPTTINILKPVSDDDNGSIDLTWSGIIENFAEVDGTYSYVTGKFGLGVQIDDDSTVSYASDMDETHSLNLWVKNPVGFTGDIVSLSGDTELIVGYDGTRFYCKIDDNSAYSMPIALPTNFYKLAILSDRIIVQTDTQTEIFGK